MILGSRGDLIMSRVFRDNLNVRLLADTFRLELIGTKKAERCPINVINKVAYLHMRFEQMYLVCCTHQDADSMASFQYMIRLLQVLYSYLDNGMNEKNIRNHFSTIQQVIDETMDYGYPQLTETQLLKSFIGLDNDDEDEDGDGDSKNSLALRKRQAQQITVKATGAIPWRAENIAYTENEMFVDVLEDINLLLSQTGQVLQCEVAGRIVCRAFLSGMPQCSMVLNDRNILESTNNNNGGSNKNDDDYQQQHNSFTDEEGNTTFAREKKEFALDDCSFHQCVKLGSLETDKAVNFVPPDGEFILMRYRTTNAIDPPFRVVNSRVQEISRSRFEVAFFLKSALSFQHQANDIKVIVPTPKNVANVKIRITHGKAKYDATKNAVIWKIPRVNGSYELPFSAEVSLLPSTLDSSSNRLVIWYFWISTIRYQDEFFEN